MPFVEMSLKSEVSQALDLPEISFPVLSSVVSESGEVPFAHLLFGLQIRSRQGNIDWRSLNPGMKKLAAILAPKNKNEVVIARGDDWRLEIGPVDMDKKMVAIQRCEELVAVIQPREDGFLRIAAFLPLDGKSAAYLIGLGRLPDSKCQARMRENNWEAALALLADAGNFQAAKNGESYLSFWEYGLGIDQNGSDVPEWLAQRGKKTRNPSEVATELGIFYTFSDLLRGS